VQDIHSPPSLQGIHPASSVTFHINIFHPIMQALNSPMGSHWLWAICHDTPVIFGWKIGFLVLEIGVLLSIGSHYLLHSQVLCLHISHLFQCPIPASASFLALWTLYQMSQHHYYLEAKSPLLNIFLRWLLLLLCP
jgi:hypothetical protein